METIKRKYIEDNYSLLPEGINIIQAHQGSGKTHHIKDLEGQSTIVVGAREELGKQLMERCPDNNFKSYKDGERYLRENELWDIKNLFICYPSLIHLHFKDFTKHTYDNLIIDEPKLVWDMGCNYHPRQDANSMFNTLLEIIPRVIVMGADIPSYIIRRLERIDNIRNTPLGSITDEYGNVRYL
jgi:hypothetical protein